MSLGVGLGVGLGRAGTRFSPTSFFAASEQGFWLPTTDLTALFKTNVGTTGNVAANDDVIGLGLEKRLMGSASASAFIAAKPELRGNGAVGLVGSATAASYNTGTGAGTLSRVDGSNQSYVQWSGLTDGQALYKLDIENTGSAAFYVRFGNYNAGSATQITAGQRLSVFVPSSAGLVTIGAVANAVTCNFIVYSFKEASGNHFTQATGTACPKYKASGSYRQYDGADDVMVGTAKAAASGNTLAAKVAIPATIAATQVIAGLQASTSTRFYLAVNTSGQLCAGVGSGATTTIVGSTDIRGLTGVAILIEDGTNVYLYWNGSLEYSGARSGAPSTTPVHYEGALNNNGTAANFFAGGIFDCLAIQRAITAAERGQLQTYWS